MLGRLLFERRLRLERRNLHDLSKSKVLFEQLLHEPTALLLVPLTMAGCELGANALRGSLRGIAHR